MKVRKLVFKNLNSLKGEWCIDFNDPAYKNDGLFAIVGPTGAGKTTILDAICLSLFGKTPRLNSITNSSNEIMNRASTECFAQTTFSNEKGVFRSSFSQRYTRRSRDAKLTPPDMELADDQTGAILAKNKSQVPQAVAEIIGLTYEQFIRAVLLAQGQFKKFLDSNANERSELLETITGTQMYSLISEKVFQRSKDENVKLETINQRLEGISLLSEEETSSMKKELEESKEQTKKLQNDIELCNKQIQWVNEVKKAEEESKSIQRNIDVNEKQLKEFEPQREQLLQDARAQKIVADYRVQEQNRVNLEKLDNQIKQDAETIKKLEKEKTSAENAVDAADAALNSAKEELNNQKPTIETVKALDTIIAEKNKNLEPEQNALRQLQREFSQACRKAGIAPEKLSEDLTADKTESQIEGILYGISISEMHQIINGFNDLKNRWKELLQVKNEIIENQQSIKKAGDELAEFSKTIEGLNKDKQTLESDLSKAEELQRSREKNVSLSRIILSLEEHRKRLVEGEPCPLCGAVSHPYGLDAPQKSLTEDEEKLEAVKKQIRELQKQLSNAEKAITKAETQSAQTEKNIENTERKIESLQKNADQICESIGCDKDITVKEIENRIRLIALKTQKTQSRLDNAETLDALKTPLQVRDKFKIQESAVKQKEDALNELISQRKEIFGADDPEQTLQQLFNAVDSAAKQLQDNKEKNAALEAELTSKIQNLETRKEERKTASKQYDDSVTELNRKLEKEGFASVGDFLKGLLTDDQRSAFQKRLKDLDDQKTSLEARIVSVNENLDALKKQNLTDKSEQELNELCNKLRTEHDELNRQIGVVTEKLSANEQRIKQYAEIQMQFDCQKTVAARWSNLNDIIGSLDGKKYRKIVQKISLEILIDYANEQMSRLAPRYQLTLQQIADVPGSEEQSAKTKKTTAVSGKEELAIFCIDAWQGNAIRPTTNLSGGESFLVSLALALGLSKMSSQNRALETLFLDEGFGSLDDVTLQTALDAINQFQYSDESNKLVGIISHVDALKERIVNKIEVTRTSNGASVLSGPGVSKIG